jgi:tetratricopeptide (TPR) repeat protein
MRLAEEADAGLRDSRQLQCLQVLEVEHDNLRTALRWSIDKHEANLAFRLVGAMGWFWFLHGKWIEARSWLTKTLALSADSSPTLRAKAIYRAGGLELIRGNLVGTTDLVEEALITCREQDDKEGLAWCLNLLGQARLVSDEGVNQGAQFLSECVELFNSLENDWGLGWSLRYLGMATVVLGNYERGIKLQKQGLHLFEEIGDIWNTAHSLFLLGNSAYQQSDYQEATSAYESSLLKSRLVEAKVITAHSQRGLAQLALKRDDLQHAGVLFQEALEAFQKIGDDSCAARTMVYLAEVGQRNGEHEQAVEYLIQGLHSFEKLGNDESTAWAIERFAALAESSGRIEIAARLLAAANAQHARVDTPLPPTRRADYKSVVTSVQKHLGDQDFEQLWAEGESMSLQEAVAYALEASRPN